MLRSKIVKVRKARVCFGCGRLFPVGAEMAMNVVADGGHMWNCYLCDTCYGITINKKSGDEFCFMDLRDEALEIEAKVAAV